MAKKIATSPIQLDKLEAILDNFEAKENWNYLAVTLLLMKATRVGDMLNVVKIKDVYTQEGEVRDELRFNEGKTGKLRIIKLKGVRIRKALAEVYAQNLQLKDRELNCFYSVKGRYNNTPISRFAYNHNLKREALNVGIPEEEVLSSHSIRKTACRVMFDNGIPIEVIMKVLNHRNPDVTRRYIGINSQDVDKAMEFLEF